MKEKLKIDYPTTDVGKKSWNKQYGFNSIYSGKHWSKRKADADYWHQITKIAMCKAHSRKTPFEKPVVITYLWNDKMDLSNHSYIAKMIEDAMKGSIIKDDSPKYVVGIEHYFHKKPYIEVVVTEIE